MAYPNRAPANTVVGKDNDAEQDVGREVELDTSRGMLDGVVERL